MGNKMNKQDCLHPECPACEVAFHRRKWVWLLPLLDCAAVSQTYDAEVRFDLVLCHVC